MELTTEQQSVINAILSGHNIALLGAAGCGKSYLLSVIYELPKIRIQMCALTGCAALLLVKAKTLHSWAGIGLGKGTVSELYVKIRRNQKSMRHWLCTDLLIIDEISMMTAELLDKLDALGKKIRANQKPFGGIQLLLVGDFFQLPPVNTSEETKFAFESNLWETMKTIELTQIFRQKDEIFHKILKEARIGVLTKESCDILSSKQGLDWKNNKIKPTLLFPKKAEVDMINETNLRALKGHVYKYNARLVYDGKTPDGFTEDENFQRALQLFDSNASYLKELELVINAQVMLIANIDTDSGLVNGSRGVITGFSLDLPIVEFINGSKKTIGTHTWPVEDYEFVSRSQIPLKLAYAVTIHKIQGSTLDSALIDIGSGVFEYGQAYVALSRVRSLDALYVYDFDPTAFKAHPKVKEFYKNIKPYVSDISAISDAIIPEEIKNYNIHNIINVIKEAEAEEAEGPEEKAEGPEIKEVEENWLYDSIPNGWKEHLCKEKLLTISNILSDKEFLPSKENIWNALIPLESINVVILGQDPYPNKEHAHGLAFSVLPHVKLPASLKNIYKELTSDGFTPPVNGNLEGWAEQGIMLLNTVLTYEGSNIGWEQITDQIIRTISEKSQVIFVLWGKLAQTKKKLIDLEKNKVLESAHPSPLSASKGFFGSKPFSTINSLLIEMGKEPIIWSKSKEISR